MRLLNTSLTSALAGLAIFSATTITDAAFAQQPSPSLPRAQRQPADMTEWTRSVSGRLQRRAGIVVRASREHKIFGQRTARLSFNLHPDGSVSDIRLVESTGDDRLDHAALQIPRLAAPFPRFTADMPPAPRPIVAPFDFNLTPPPPPEQPKL